jgi:drug/metabolite transporter (DMT)-like permease
MSKLSKAYLAALLFAFTIGFSFLFVKKALPFINPTDLLAHRFTVAFLAALAVLAFKRNEFHITWADLLKVLPLALFYPIGFFAFQVFGLVELSSSEAGIIQATIPVFTLLFAAFFLKEFPTFLQSLCILLTVAGMAYIFIMSGIDSESYTTRGVILILLSTLAGAFYNVFTRTLTKKYSILTLTWIMSFWGFIFFNSIALGIHIDNHTLASYFTPLFNHEVLLSVLFLGCFSSFGTAFLSNYALSQIQASKLSVFNNFSTLVAIFAGYFFLHEPIHFYHIIGAGIIIAGVVGTNYFSKKANL